jgi:hypothetical protein
MTNDLVESLKPIKQEIDRKAEMEKQQKKENELNKGVLKLPPYEFYLLQTGK